MGRNNVGLIIAGQSRRLDNDTIYNSRRKKLTVDPESVPPHFDLLENFSGGTKWVVPTDEYREEILLQIPHNMPFKPMFYAYFLQTSFPGGSAGPFAAQYSTNISLMLFNAVGLGQEELFADADEDNFYIKHRFQSTTGFGGGGDATAYGDDYKFTIRYFIFNQPSFLFEGGEVDAL
jgi:hypothetical protein